MLRKSEVRGAIAELGGWCLISLVRCFLVFLFISSASFAEAQNILMNVDFSDPSLPFSSWSSPSVTGQTIITNENSGYGGLGLFTTQSTSSYLLLTANASAVTSSTYYGGWAKTVALPTITSGLGETDPSKISLTAQVRARGMPSHGATVGMFLRSTADNPGNPMRGYKRVIWERTLLSSDDWIQIGGAFDMSSLALNAGSTYNFDFSATEYQIVFQISGFNQFGAPGYVEYNTPTGAPSGAGFKNPGWGFTDNIRVEIDNVKLAVASVPEPSGFSLLVVGLSGLSILRRRRS